MRTKTFLLGAALAALVSCNQNKGNSETLVAAKSTISGDSLQLVFNDAWNSHDSVRVVNLFTENAILLNGRTFIQGRQQLADRWIHNQLPIIENLKTKSVQNAGDENTCYSAGTGSLEVNVPGKPVFSSTGNYSFIFRKQDDGSWKVAMMNIEDHDPEPATEAKK